MNQHTWKMLFYCLKSNLNKKYTLQEKLEYKETKKYIFILKRYNKKEGTC